MADIKGSVAKSIRRLGRIGYAVEWIARRHDLDPAAVRAFLATLPIHEHARDPKRQIRGKLVTRVLDLSGRGWSAQDIAAALHLAPRTVGDFLDRFQPVRRDRITRPRTRREQEAWERNERARQRRQARLDASKFVDEWKAAAAGDERYRDPVSPLERTEAPVVKAIAAELLDQMEAELSNVVNEHWGSPTGGGNAPRKITAAVLAEALALHQAGESWPAIAKRLGVSRNGLWYARQR